jgi:hypothetical protein
MKPTTIPMSRARDSPTLSPTPVPSTPLPTIFFSTEVPDRAEAALKKVEAGTVGDEQQKASAQQRADLVSDPPAGLFGDQIAVLYLAEPSSSLRGASPSPKAHC